MSILYQSIRPTHAISLFSSVSMFSRLLVENGCKSTTFFHSTKIFFHFFSLFFLIYLFSSTNFFTPPPPPSTLLFVASGEKGLFSAVFHRTSLYSRKQGSVILMSINILDLLLCLNKALGQRFMKINAGQVAFSGSGDATCSQHTGSGLGAVLERPQ